MSIKGEEMKNPLINSAVLEVQTDQEQESAFIARYNEVINTYNKYSQEGSPKMEVMVGNVFLKRISEYLSRPQYIVAVLVVMLIFPVVNIFCLACIFSYFFYLRKQNKKHLRNLNRVKDPFEHFFFAPEMCQNIGKHHSALNLQQNQIKGFTFNEQLRVKFEDKLRCQFGESLTVVIYDQYFFDSFYLYRKELYKTLVWLLVGVILLTISTIFYVYILHP